MSKTYCPCGQLQEEKHVCPVTYAELEQQLSAALAAHEETKRELRHMCKSVEDLTYALIKAEAKLKELQEQKQDEWDGNCPNECRECEAPELCGRDKICFRSDEPFKQKYTLPIDVEALLQQARKEENEACAEVSSDLIDRARSDEVVAAIRARMK